MKKMFFTAVAMIAFSGVSMAKTVESKELSSIETKSIKVIVENDREDCVLAATYVYEFFIDYLGDGTDDIDFLNALIATCD